MKRIRIEITQELEVPDSCDISTDRPAPQVRLAGRLLSPHAEYMQVRLQKGSEIQYGELDENVRDELMRSLAKETITIKQIK